MLPVLKTRPPAHPTPSRSTRSPPLPPIHGSPCADPPCSPTCASLLLPVAPAPYTSWDLTQVFLPLPLSLSPH